MRKFVSNILIANVVISNSHVIVIIQRFSTSI